MEIIISLEMLIILLISVLFLATHSVKTNLSNQIDTYGKKDGKYDKNEIIDMLSYLFKISKQVDISLAHEDNLDNQVEMVEKEVQEFNMEISAEINKLSLEETLTYSADIVKSIIDEIGNQSDDLLEQQKRKTCVVFKEENQNNFLNYEDHIKIYKLEDNLNCALGYVMFDYESYTDTNEKGYYRELMTDSFYTTRVFLQILANYRNNI